MPCIFIDGVDLFAAVLLLLGGIQPDQHYIYYTIRGKILELGDLENCELFANILLVNFSLENTQNARLSKCFIQ